MPGLSVRMAFWHTVRIVVYARLCIKARKFLEKNFKQFNGSKLIVALALLLGAIVYQVIQKIIDKFLRTLMPLHDEDLLPFDELFLFDPDSPSNAACIFRFPKFKPEQMLDFLRNQFAERLPKTKVKLVSIFGKFYWYKMSEEEFNRKFDQMKIVIDDVRTMKQLEDFTTVQLNTAIDIHNDLPWRFNIFNNIEGEDSYLLLYGHHSWSDGISMLNGFRQLSQNKSKEVINMPGLSAWQQALGSLLSPLFALKISLNLLISPFDRNCFMNKPTPKLSQRDRCILLGKPQSRTQYSKSCKQFKCSSTTAAQAILGKSISDYIAAIGEKQVDKVTYATTFSLQPYAERLEQVKIGNYFVALVLPLLTSPDLKKNIIAAKKQSMANIGTLELLGMQAQFKYIFMLPYNLAQPIVDFICAKRTMQFSSAPAPKEGFNFNGIQSNGIYGFVPFVRDSTWGLTVVSCDDIVNPALIADKYYMEHPDKFMEIFNRNMTDFVQLSQKPEITSNKLANEIVKTIDPKNTMTVSKL